MKATIETDRSARLLSWAVAAVVAIGGALLILLLPEPDNSKVRLPDKPKARLEKPEDKEKREKPLPEELVEARIEAAEIVVKKELRERLKLFQEIDEDVTADMDRLLDSVDTRPLDPGLPAEINDTSEARESAATPPPAAGGDASVEDLYETLADYEARILEIHRANLAAAEALRNGVSFPDTLRAMQESSTRMPGYESLVEAVKNQHDIDGDLLPPRPSTNDVNRYRDLLDQTTRQSGLAESRLLGLVTEIGRKPPPPAPPPSSTGGPKTDGDGGLEVDGNVMKKMLYQMHEPKFESEELVAAQALPGRRFSRDSARKGWLYVNTWYMIGPWDSHGRNDFSLTHPPERGIDLDAVYRDGQIGEGVAETDSHPLKITGDEVDLDGTLRWKFMQSESMHNVMPVTSDNSTCYAYTELYFDQSATMLVAIGTDDSGKLWINGKEIWQDEGASWYHIDEHLEPIVFRQGWNRILVRIDNNGGAASGFSFLICPKDAPVRDNARAR